MVVYSGQKSKATRIQFGMTEEYTMKNRIKIALVWLTLLVCCLALPGTWEGCDEIQAASGKTGGFHLHAWQDATCQAPKTCYLCGATKGKIGDHWWADATCTQPKTCLVCGATQGKALGHLWDRTGETCTECGAKNSPEPEEPTGPVLKTPELGMVAAGNYHSVYLRPDGTVVAVGSNKLVEDGNRGTRLDTENWTDIVAVSASSHTVGLKADGTVRAVGPNQYGQCEVGDWENIIAIDAGDNHTVGLCADGTVVAAGDNEHGQCDVENWRNIVAIAVSKQTTYGLTQSGRVLSAGEKNYGFTWKDIVAIDAAPYHLVGIRSDGTVVQSGGCDSWEESTEGWSGIVAVSAGNLHTVGIKENGKVVACGSERVEDQCDVKSWKNIVQISAGLYHTVALKEDGSIVAVGSNGFGQCDIEGYA